MIVHNRSHERFMNDRRTIYERFMNDLKIDRRSIMIDHDRSAIRSRSIGDSIGDRFMIDPKPNMGNKIYKRAAHWSTSWSRISQSPPPGPKKTDRNRKRSRRIQRIQRPCRDLATSRARSCCFFFFFLLRATFQGVMLVINVVT
jgi:hypothetical protein